MVRINSIAGLVSALKTVALSSFLLLIPAKGAAAIECVAMADVNGFLRYYAYVDEPETFLSGKTIGFGAKEITFRSGHEAEYKPSPDASDQQIGWLVAPDLRIDHDPSRTVLCMGDEDSVDPIHNADGACAAVYSHKQLPAVMFVYANYCEGDEEKFDLIPGIIRKYPDDASSEELDDSSAALDSNAALHPGELSCSSVEVTRLVAQLAEESLATDETAAMSMIYGKPDLTFDVKHIRTTGELYNGLTCSAEVAISRGPSSTDNLTDPAVLFLLQQGGAKMAVNYTVEQTDDGEIYVQVH